MKTKVKTIDVNCKEWFDKINGNSYFAGSVIINYGLKTAKAFNMSFQYGYGDHYIDMAKELLNENNIIKTDNMSSLWRYCDDNKIILRTNIQRNCKKRELMNY